MLNNIRVLAITAEKDPSPCIQDQLCELEQLGVEVERLAINRSHRWPYLDAAIKVLRLSLSSRHFDLVHGFYGYCGLIARMQFRFPVVVTFQGSDMLGGKNGYMHKKDGMIGRTAARLANAVIVMTDEMRRLSPHRYTQVIAFGINTDIFHPMARDEARRNLNLDVDAQIALFPWSPSRPEKHFAIAEAAVALLKHDNPHVQLLPVYNQPREVVAQYMNACDALVLVSEHEGSPVAVREALACNLPIVSVDVGDVHSVIKDLDNCYICERTPDDVAAKLRTVLNSGQRTNAAPKMAAIDVNWSAKRVLRVYESLLGPVQAAALHGHESIGN